MSAALASAVFIVAVGSARADRIEYADGRVMEGTIIRVDDDFVVIEDGTADFKIPRSLVTRIIEGTAADRWLHSAKAKLSSNDPEGAIQDLAAAVSEGVAPESLAAVMVRFDTAIADVIPGLPVQRRNELLSTLAVLDKAKLPRQGGLVLARIRWYLKLGDVNSAAPLIDELRTHYPDDYEPSRETLIEWFDRNIDDFLQSGKYDEALDYLVQLRRLDAERAGDKRILLVLQWARRERDGGRYEQAIQIYANQLMDQSPEIARNRIADALEQAEFVDRNADNLGRSISLYEHYGLQYVSDFAKPRLAQLWLDLGFKQLHRNEIPSARKSFTRVDELRPGTANEGFIQCEYSERQGKVKKGTPLDQYQLGEWCISHGLWVEARQAFLKCSESEDLRPASQAQLKFIDNMLNEKELGRLVALYEKGKYLEVLNGVHEYRGRPLSRGFRSQAEQLEALTQEAIQMTVAERPQQAEVLWQQAERAFYLRDYAKSQSLLRTLIDRYGDTPAGVRGEEFYRRVRPTLALNQMESNSPVAPNDLPAIERSKGGSSALAEEIRRLRRDSPGSASGQDSNGATSPTG